MNSVLEMGGAANFWVSPSGREYSCQDHVNWAAEQVLKQPLPDLATGDNAMYWAARGRIYAKMFKRGWMRVSAYHQEDKLVVDYWRGTVAQWEWVYEKAGKDHMLVVDYTDNKPIIDYRSRQGPQGSPYGVWEATDPDDIDPKEYLQQYGAYDWKTRLRARGFRGSGMEDTDMEIRTGEHVGDKSLRVSYEGVHLTGTLAGIWRIGAFQFGDARGRAIFSASYRTEWQMLARVDKLLAAWGLSPRPLSENIEENPSDEEFKRYLLMYGRPGPCLEQCPYCGRPCEQLHRGLHPDGIYPPDSHLCQICAIAMDDASVEESATNDSNDPDDPNVFIRNLPARWAIQYWKMKHINGQWLGRPHYAFITRWKNGKAENWKWVESRQKATLFKSSEAAQRVLETGILSWADAIEFEESPGESRYSIVNFGLTEALGVDDTENSDHPDNPQAWFSRETDWFQTAREHGYQGTLPGDNPFKDIYEKGWQPTNPTEISSFIIGVYAYRHAPGFVSLTLFDHYNKPRCFKVPKVRLSAALDWWDAEMKDFTAYAHIPAKAERFLHWLTSEVAEAMVECLLMEADPDDIDPESYFKNTVDMDRQMQELGFEYRALNQNLGAPVKWIKVYTFDKSVQANWGEWEKPRMVSLVGFNLYDMENPRGDILQYKGMNVGWRLETHGNAPFLMMNVTASPPASLVSALRRVVHSIDRFMSTYTTKRKDGEQVMREVTALLKEARMEQYPEGEWRSGAKALRQRMRESTDPDDPEQFIKHHGDELYGALDQLEQWLRVTERPNSYFQALALNKKVRLKVMRLIDLPSGEPFWNVLLYSTATKKLVQHVDAVMNLAMVVPTARRLLDVQVQFLSEDLQTEEPDEPTPEALKHLLGPMTKDTLRARLRSLSVMNPWISWSYGGLWNVRGVTFGTQGVWTHIDDALKTMGLHPQNWDIRFNDQMNGYRHNQRAPAPNEECWRSIEFQLAESDISKDKPWELKEAVDPDDPVSFIANFKPHKFILHCNDEERGEWRLDGPFYSLEAAVDSAREQLVHDHSSDVYIDELDPRDDPFNYLRRFWLNQEYEVCREEEGNIPLGESADPDDPAQFLKSMKGRWVVSVRVYGGVLRYARISQWQNGKPNRWTWTSNSARATWFKDREAAERQLASMSNLVDNKSRWNAVNLWNLGEAVDPDDPEVFLKSMPVNMVEWLKQMGFEDQTNANLPQNYHFVRTVPPAGTIAASYVPYKDAWYVYAYNMPVRDAYVEGHVWKVQPKIEEWLKVQQEILGESLDPDDPEEFLRNMPVNMRAWLEQMGFQDITEQTGWLAHFYRARVGGCVPIEIKCLRNPLKWYAQRWDTTGSNVQGTEDEVRVQVQQWLREQDAVKEGITQGQEQVVRFQPVAAI